MDDQYVFFWEQNGVTAFSAWLITVEKSHDNDTDDNESDDEDDGWWSVDDRTDDNDNDEIIFKMIETRIYIW